jgi:hypothetical protein
MKSLSLALFLCPLLSLHAADPATQIAERGKLVLSEDFNQSLDTKAWNAPKGKWEIADGALKGAEVKTDKHPGVIRHALAIGDCVIQYDVKVDGAKGTTLSVNSPKGHLCRVLIDPTGFKAQKDDSDHEGPDVAVPFGRRALAFKAGEWHTVVAEIVGDTLVATVDGGNPIAGSQEMITQKKGNFGFTVNGETVSVRNVRVWEATAKSDAAQVKAKLISETPKPAPAPAAAGKKKAAK